MAKTKSPALAVAVASPIRPRPKRGHIIVDAVHSDEAIEFDAWAQRLVDRVIEREHGRSATRDLNQ